MKMNRIVTACVFIMGTGLLNAQTTIYDANRWMGSDLNGTARFIGVGGAMGALGGDITTMGTNPAGIGIYRSNDAMVTFGFDNIGTKANGVAKDKFYGSFDNAGIVFSTKIGNVTSVRYANFGFNYRKMKSFNKSMLVNGVNGASQTAQFANMLNYTANNTFDPITEAALKSDGAYENSELPWLGIMAYNAFLVAPVYGKADPANPKAERPFNGYVPYVNSGDAVTQSYYSKEKGGIHAFDLNGSLNIRDRVYIGATVGLYSVNYDKSSNYSEDFVDKVGNAQGGYTLNNDFRVDGNGVDFKLGVIVRPFGSSSFRIGAAVHTPTYFSLRERYISSINYDVIYEDKLRKDISKPYNRYGDNMEGDFSYRLLTSWKFNVNTGYTIGTVAALGAEYEFANRSTGKVRDLDGYEMGVTNDVKAMMKPVHTIRLGAEFKLAPEFAFRVGYNHITAPLRSDAFKYMQPNSARTDTEFSNPGATNNYTLGFGYRGESFYVDMAYLYNTYNETFYAFENVDLPGTKVKNNNHKVAVTLGMRF